MRIELATLEEQQRLEKERTLSRRLSTSQSSRRNPSPSQSFVGNGPLLSAVLNASKAHDVDSSMQPSESPAKQVNNAIPSVSLSKEANYIATTLSDVESSLESSKRQRAFARGKRASEIQTLKENLEKVWVLESPVNVNSILFNPYLQMFLLMQETQEKRERRRAQRDLDKKDAISEQLEGHLLIPAADSVSSDSSGVPLPLENAKYQNDFAEARPSQGQEVLEPPSSDSIQKYASENRGTRDSAGCENVINQAPLSSVSSEVESPLVDGKDEGGSTAIAPVLTSITTPTDPSIASSDNANSSENQSQKGYQNEQPKGEKSSSFLHKLRVELKSTAPASNSTATSPTEKLSPGFSIAPGLGSPVSSMRSRSRSGSFISHHPLLVSPSLFRILGTSKFYVVAAPEVSTSWVSKTDSYVLLLPNKLSSISVTSALPNDRPSILLWHGPNAAKMKKVKAIEFAHKLRDFDLGGKGLLEEADEGAPLFRFWNALGVEGVRDIASTIDSLSNEGSELANVELYEYPFLDDPVQSGRIPPQRLFTDRCHVIVGSVQSGNSGISRHAFLWIGKSASIEDPNIIAKQILVSHGILPSIIREGEEPTLFKEYLLEKVGAGSLSRSNSFTKEIRSLDKVEHDWSLAINAFPIPESDGIGKNVVKILLSDQGRTEVLPSCWGIFQCDQVYLILTEKSLVKWIGADAVDSPLSVLIASEMDSSGRMKTIVVHQFKEPNAFYSVFSKVVYKGPKADQYSSNLPQLFVSHGRVLEQVPAVRFLCILLSHFVKLKKLCLPCLPYSIFKLHWR
jgi:hypothetical protein